MTSITGKCIIHIRPEPHRAKCGRDEKTKRCCGINRTAGVQKATAVPPITAETATAVRNELLNGKNSEHINRNFIKPVMLTETE